MTARRALVQRKGCRSHLGTLAAGDAVWLTACNREVPVFGAVVLGTDWLAWLPAAEHAPDMCTRCRTFLLGGLVALADVEGVRVGLDDRARLVEQVRALGDVVRRYGERILRTSTGTANPSAAQAEARADRRLRRLGL